MKLRLITLWSNVLYVVAIAVALSVALGLVAALGATPWRAFVNVAIVIVVAATTGILNVRCLRRKRWAATSAVAIGLNLICLGYLLVRPEYAHVLLEVAVVLIPLLNIALLIGDRRSAHHSRSSNSMSGRTA